MRGKLETSLLKSTIKLIRISAKSTCLITTHCVYSANPLLQKFRCAIYEAATMQEFYKTVGPLHLK